MATLINTSDTDSLAAKTASGNGAPADPMLICMTMAAKLLGQPVHIQVLRAGFALNQNGQVPLSAYPLSLIHI